MASYTPIVTLLGQAQIADAIANEEAVNISHMAVGDGGGASVTPLENMTALTNEVWRGSIQSVARDDADPTRVIFTATIPLEAGPFVIREIALFSSNGQMFAIGAYPQQFKPTAAEGAVSSIQVEFVVIVSETAQVTVTVNPSQLTFLNNFGRIPFYAVDGFVNDPPSNPTAGDMVLVGPSPQSAFVGHTNKLAQWNGFAWLVAQPPVATIVGIGGPSGEYYRWDGAAWVPWRATQTRPGLVTMQIFEKMPIWPEVSAPLVDEGYADINPSGEGFVAISTGQKVLWRGCREFDSTDFDVEDRTFATLANKTYHFRWHAPGHGDAANTSFWPNGRFVLKDVSASGYNPSAFPEAHQSLDTTFDDVLLAKVTTNGANEATVRTLKNLHQLTFSARTTGEVQVGTTGSRFLITTVTLNWARTARVRAITGNIRANEISPAGTMDGHAGWLSEVTLDRYTASGWVMSDWATATVLNDLMGYIDYHLMT